MYFQRSLCHLCHLCLLYRLYRCVTSCIKRRKDDGRPLALIRPGNEAAPLALRAQPGRKEQGLVKIPRIFLAPPLLTSLAPTGRALRQAREPGKIGLALLQEGISPLLTLFGHVVEHRCIAGQLLNTRQTVGVCIESRFQEA
jgi:hypothetical protein